MTEPTDAFTARVFNAIAPVLKAHDYWLPLSVRRAVADAVVTVTNEEIGDALCVGHDSRRDEIDRLRAYARKRAEDNIRLRAELDDLRAVDADRLKLSEENVQLSEENAALRARVAELEQQAVTQDPSIPERVLAVCAELPPPAPGSQAEAVAHCKGWNDAMDAVTAAFRPADFARSMSLSREQEARP